MSLESPCLSCGACCAHFRVSFYWGECQSTGGLVPDDLTLQVSPHHACMKGTETNPVHCTALDGVVGSQVSCRIYENRPSTCREFDILDEQGQLNEACTRARAHYGLPPILLATDQHLDRGLYPGDAVLISSSLIVDNAQPAPDITHL